MRCSPPWRSCRAATALRFSIPIERRTPGAFVLSNDGSFLLYTEIGSRGTPQLYIRHLDREEPAPVEGTDRAVAPFLSPDGSRIGFVPDGNLRIVAATGGAPTTLAPSADPGGAAWSDDGTIIFSSGGKLYRIPETGGKPTLLAEPDSSIDGYMLPTVSPDQRTVAFSILSVPTLTSTLGLLSVEDRTVTRLPVQARRPAFVTNELLTFVDEAGTLLTARLNSTRRGFVAPLGRVHGGGFEPRWARKGSEIFYRSGDTLFTVPVRFGVEPFIGKPRALFSGSFETSVYQAFYDVAPNGKEFAFTRRIGDGREEYHVVLHWLK